MGQLEREGQDIGSKYAGFDSEEAGAGGFHIHELGEGRRFSGPQKGQEGPEILETGFSASRFHGTQSVRNRGGEESSFPNKKRGVAGTAAEESQKNLAGSSPIDKTSGSKSGVKASKTRGGREGNSHRQGGRGIGSAKGNGAANSNSSPKDGAPRNGGASPPIEREEDAHKNSANPAVFHEDVKSEVPMDDVKPRAKGNRPSAMEGGGVKMYFDIGRWSSHDMQWPDPAPTLAAAGTWLRQTNEKLLAFIEVSWPLAKRWFWLISRAILVLSFLSLECAVRGFSSLFRLGSAALFLLVWCTALNLTMLAGIGNFGVALGASLAAGFFLGYTFAFGIMGLFGVVVLWMFGSFWITGAMIALGGGLFVFDHARKSILITMLYSIYSVKGHGGWMGLTFSTIAAFISSDVVVYFLSNGSEGRQGAGFDGKQSGHAFDQGNSKFGPSPDHSGKTRHSTGSTASGGSFSQGASAGFTSAGFSQSAPTSDDIRSSAGASTSANSEGGDPTSAEEEVARVLGCSDHYAVLGFARYDNFDMGVLKREYRKLAMLVHPDKNRGNDKAEEAFKRLQNAYEVLLDTIKRKVYDEDLRREEALENFRQHRQWFHQAGRCQSPNCGCQQQSDEEAEDDVPADSRRIACKRCNDNHVWIATDRGKLRARWCQECQDYHQAKDGDGWVEQSGQSFFFGMFQKVDVPRAYACAEGKVYDVTEWVICQGMKCPPNTHKPTFHVSTAGAGKSAPRGAGRTTRGGGRANAADGFSFPDFDENMTEHEFFDWLEAAMASGMFSDANGVPTYPGAKGATKGGKPSTRKKRKGKKQW